jgi:monomeric sarcosine oxidase
MDTQLDVIVVGGGLMGSATAWSLARRQRSVLLVEQFSPANRHGSSHGSARIVRRGYDDALYTGLTGLAFELWQELERESGARLLRTLGGLEYGDARNVGAVAQHLAREGAPHEQLSAQEAEDRWAGMRFEGTVLFHPQAGTVDAALAVEAFIAQAGRRGANVRREAEVVRVIPGEDRTEIELDGGERLGAKSVVVAAGAWIPTLLDGLVALPSLAVTQQQIFHFPRLDRDAEPWPSVIHEAAESIYHLAGGRDGGPGDDRKIAEHRHGTRTTADGRSGEVDPASRARIVDYVSRWLPGLDPGPRGEATCLYTTTPSEDFVLDRVGSLVICSPCSGHGAKFAPLIGELTADLVTSPGSAEIPERFRLASHARPA